MQSPPKQQLNKAYTLSELRAHTHTQLTTPSHFLLFLTPLYPQLRDRNQLRGAEERESNGQKGPHKLSLISPTTKTLTPLSTTGLLICSNSQRPEEKKGLTRNEHV